MELRKSQKISENAAVTKELLRKKQQVTDNLKLKIGRHTAASNTGSEMAGKQI